MWLCGDKKADDKLAMAGESVVPHEKEGRAWGGCGGPFRVLRRWYIGGVLPRRCFILQCWCWYMCNCCNWCGYCTFLKSLMVVTWCEHIPRRRCCVMLRYWNMCDYCVYWSFTLEEGGGSLVWVHSSEVLCYDAVLCWYISNCFNCCVCCTTFLKKVVAAWCECIPRRCQSEQSISVWCNKHTHTHHSSSLSLSRWSQLLWTLQMLN